MIPAAQKPSKLLCICMVLLLGSLSCGGDSEEAGSSVPADQAAHEVQEGVPTLIDLGSMSCVPCVMMESELERLDDLTGDRLTVTFIDVYHDTQAASRYSIRIIPTQLFLAPDGTELYRHEGYMSAEQMLARWIALGYDLNESAEAQ